MDALAARAPYRAAGAAVLLGCVALLSGCATPEAPRPLLRQAVQRRASPAQQQRLVIDGYGRERGCRGPAYSAARRYATRWLDSVVSVPTEPARVADAAANARFRLRLAETAARKRCFDIARDTYVEVGDIFTGDPYAKLRERADVGLSALPPAPGEAPHPAVP